VSVTTSPTTVEHSLKRAELLLARARLELAAGVDHDQAAAMLARVLGSYSPFATEHGRLLVAALRARSRAEQQTGPRPVEERAVRELLRRGEPPWPTAVAAWLDQQQQRARALAAKAARLRPVAERDATAAVAAVVDAWKAAGRAPSPATVGHQLGWPLDDTWAILRLLITDGWLALEHRRLVPGPKARSPAGPNATPAG
jgi:hypothetical protein